MNPDLLGPYGCDARVRALGAPHDGTLARVVRIDRGVYSVMTDTGPLASSLSGELKDMSDPTQRPTIGDWVMIDADGVVRTVLTRTSVFLRGDSDRLQAQAVAANIDVVFVTQAANDLNVRRLERELVLAHQSGAVPVVVLSKSDLCDDLPAVEIDAAASAPGLNVIATSSVDGRGLDALRRYGQPHQTVAFIGASGVGKSSLVNALLESSVQSTGAIREHDGRGRHTTSARSMFVLQSGGVLIDTPGLRSIGMWRSDEGIAEAFSDIEVLAQGCRFSNCSHDHEPACAVRDAVAVGAISAARVANYRALHAELDHLDDEAEQRRRVVKQQQRTPTRRRPSE